MVDSISKAQRSALMAQIRGKNTKPELVMRSALHRLGLRFKIHDAALPGKPDIVLPKYNAIVLVNGCFWHGHTNCKQASRPSSNRKYWNQKIDRNIERDLKNIRRLRRLGWHVHVIWECKIGKPAKAIAVAERLARRFKQENRRVHAKAAKGKVRKGRKEMGWP